jgi:hypothetical protein
VEEGFLLGAGWEEFLQGTVAVGIVVMTILWPALTVAPPVGSPSLGPSVFYVSTNGSLSYALFHCGMIVTTGTQVLPAAWGERFNPPFPVDRFQWICSRQRN